MVVRYVQTCRLPTPFGVFQMHGFEEPDTGKEHVALTLGDLESTEPMLARTHSECLTGDALYSMRCDCGYQLEEANERLGFAADLRDYAMCKDMLEHLGIRSLKLMTNNPRKVDSLRSLGIDIAERVPLHVGRNPHNEHYLNTKQSKLGHWLETHQDDDPQ